MPEAQTTMIKNLSAAFTAAGVDVKGLLAKIGDLGTLTTTQRASLVGALNELKTGVDAAVKIDDAKTQAGTTWSSTKINSAINAAISALVSGAPEALDTIKEVADAINTNKNAITALQQIAAGHVKFDDAKTQAGTTWSSTKINSAINAAISALVSGAPEALDTIKEVADAINTNKNAITALQQIAAGHVKFDAAQTLSDTQKQQARENIDAVSAAQLAATDTKAQKGVDDAAAAKAQADKGVRDAATAKTAAEKANGDLTTFKTNIGDTTVDFAAVYTAARDAN